MARRPRIDYDWLYDLETEDWTIPVLCGKISKHREIEMTRNAESMVMDLIDCGGVVGSWNGGTYDNLYAASLARQAGRHVTAYMGGTRATTIEIGQTEFRDPIALIPMSLAKAYRLLGRGDMAKDTGIPCECDRNCGGYCGIKVGMSDARYRSLSEYLAEDLYSMYDIVHFVHEYLREYGWEIKNTVGATAWATAAKMSGIKKPPWKCSGDYKFARTAFFGGRVQGGMTFSPIGASADIHSCYPGALRDMELPVGDYETQVSDDAESSYRRGKEGIYQVTVEIPYMHLPPLPVRYKERVIYPYGEVTGAWCGLELRYAESIGVKIHAFHRALVWESSDKVLAPFMQWGWDQRDKAGKDTALGQLMKWLINSMTGKCSQKPERSVLHINPDWDEIRRCNAAYDCGDNCRPPKCCIHNCYCGSWSKVGLMGDVWAEPFWKIPSSGYVHWGVYLTAGGRINWHKQANRNGGLDFVYGDTDCVRSEIDNFINLGPDLGQWGHEGLYKDLLVIAPKLYSYYSLDKNKQIVKAKGLSGITHDDLIAFMNGDRLVNKRGVWGLKSAVRKRGKDLFLKKELTRSNKQTEHLCGDRRLSSNGVTYPCTVPEYVQLRRFADKQSRETDGRERAEREIGL